MPSYVAATTRGPVEYWIEGSGPAVMVLQGGHCSRTTRLSHERLASHGFTVITPSRPGYDRTPPYVGRSALAAADAVAALLDVLGVPAASMIGISAAGPTALAFAQRYPERTKHLVMESAVVAPWSPSIQRLSKLAFGPTQALTWAMIRAMLRVNPTQITKTMLREFTTLDVETVYARLSKGDVQFVQRMIASMRSGKGFVLDVKHTVERFDAIEAPILAMYSPHDHSVPQHHLHMLQRELPHTQTFLTPADSHLIWIGPGADEVWQRRLAFLCTTA